MSVRVLTVPDDLSLTARIARGHYDEIESRITEEYFPITADQVGVWEWDILSFGLTVSTEKAVQLIQKSGFMPAHVAHLLAFGEITLGMRKNPVIALGSSAWIYGRAFPAIEWWSNRNERYLTLEHAWFLEGWRHCAGWPHKCQFLCVRRNERKAL